MKINNLPHYLIFKNECTIFHCASLFEGDWVGPEKYIVASDTSEDELRKKYPEIMSALSPLICCSAECGKVYKRSQRNIEKHKKRQKKTVELSDNCFLDHQEDDLAFSIILEEAKSMCTETEWRRFYRYSFEDYSIEELAREEGVTIAPVFRSIKQAQKKIRAYFEGGDEYVA